MNFWRILVKLSLCFIGQSSRKQQSYTQCTLEVGLSKLIWCHVFLYINWLFCSWIRESWHFSWRVCFFFAKLSFCGNCVEFCNIKFDKFHWTKWYELLWWQSSLLSPAGSLCVHLSVDICKNGCHLYIIHWILMKRGYNDSWVMSRLFRVHLGSYKNIPKYPQIKEWIVN